MKRIVLTLAFVFLTVLSLSSFTYSENRENNNNDNNSFQNRNFAVLNLSNETDFEKELENIYEDFLELLPDEFPEGTKELSGFFGIESVLGFIKDAVLGEENRILKTFLRFLGISLIFALAEIFCSEIGELSPSVKSALAVCLSLPVLTFAKDTVFMVKSGIESGSEFFSGIIPILCSVLAIGTGASTASASASGMSLSLSFISGFLSNNLLPVSALIFSISLISTIDTGQGISGASRGIRGWFNFGIGVVSVVLVATMTFQSVISASADSLTLRGAKYALSNMIPIAGGVVSGALSTLASGVKMLSSSIGVMSVAVILSFMGAPLISLLLYRLCMGACITFCSLAGASYGQKFFESVRGALDCIIGILSFSLLIYILEITLFMKLIGGVL